MTASEIHGPQGHVDEKTALGLTKAGIGRRYHNMTFLKFGDLGTSLLTWAKSAEFIEDMKSGTGRHFYGPGAHDLFMVMAKATFLRNRKVRVIALSVLVNEVTSTDIRTDLDEAQVLFLTPLFRDEYKQPLDDWKRLAVEDFLMERLDRGCSVFTTGDRTLNESRAWWSTTMIRRLQVVNMEIEVK